jgi:hypothetical protein
VQVTVVIRWDEKSGLRQEAARSQVIDMLEAQETKENSGAFLSARGNETCNFKNAPGRCLATLPLRLLPGGGANSLAAGLASAEVQRLSRRTVTTVMKDLGTSGSVQWA